MTKTFAPAQPPNLPSSKTSEQRLLQAQFGDGYEQRAGDGINADRVKWSLTWNAVTNEEADAIELALRGGVFEPFLYEVPGDVERLYLTDPNTVTRGLVSVTHDTISVALTEVFA